MIELLVLLVITQAADVISTHYALKVGLVEGNLIPAKLFERFGFWPSAIGMKIFIIAACWAIQTYIYKGWITTFAMSVISVGIVAWNLWRIKKAHRS